MVLDDVLVYKLHIVTRTLENNLSVKVHVSAMVPRKNKERNPICYAYYFLSGNLYVVCRSLINHRIVPLGVASPHGSALQYIYLSFVDRRQASW